ncbi:MAG: SLC13 family permease [Chitinophagales bacterium]
MGIDAIIVLVIIVIALALFVSELLTIDLVALLIMVALVITGVLNVEEAVSGFSNPATVTVAAMFAISAAMLKTGLVSTIGPRLAKLIKKNFFLGSLVLMVSVGIFSAFINNTPVVAVFIPIIIKAAISSGYNPTKLLIPLSFASIFGGTCTLIGTSTNLLVSGIAVQHGLEPFSMFQVAPFGIVIFTVGILFMLFIGQRLLPDRIQESDLEKKFNMRDYLIELTILEDAPFVGQRIMDVEFIKDLDMDVIQIRRAGEKFLLPPQDMVLQENDKLKVRCNYEKIKQLKNQLKIFIGPAVYFSESDLTEDDTTLVELIIPPNSFLEGETLGNVEFKRRFRAVPLAIRHRAEIQHEKLNNTRISAGDIILAEIKTHRLELFKNQEAKQESPFIILSEESRISFDKKRFGIVLSVALIVVLLATFNILPILAAALIGVATLVLIRQINMKDVYEAIDWKVITLLAGALSLGTAMQKSGLALYTAENILLHLGEYGPVAIISGLYLITIILTEMISNNATAALLAPVAIITAEKLGLNPMPFLMAITFAASASFITPIGYQTNTMVYSAGQYQFKDFFKVGIGLSLILWLLATLLIPMIYEF